MAYADASEAGDAVEGVASFSGLEASAQVEDALFWNIPIIADGPAIVANLSGCLRSAQIANHMAGQSCTVPAEG